MQHWNNGWEIERISFSSSFHPTERVTFLAQRGCAKWYSIPIRGKDREVISYLFVPHISQLFSHHSKLISLLILQQSSSFLHFMLKLIMLMSTLNEKKINFHCCTALTNNEVQVRRKCEIITQGTLSLLFVPTYEQKWRGSSGRSWGGYLEVCLTFNKILKKALKRQLNIDCLLIAERGGEGRNHCNKFLSKNKNKKPNHPFMNVINITELKSLFKVQRYGTWKMRSWQPKFTKAICY